MATIADKLGHLSATKALIRDAIINKGVAVGVATPFRQYASKIAAISQSESGQDPGPGSDVDEWVRPSDRPEVPVVNDNEIYMLYCVTQGSPNDYSFNIAMSDTGSSYMVDWGDGVLDEFSSSTRAEHQYYYASLDAPVVDDKFKWVWIRVYPKTTGTNITGLYLNVRPSWRPAGSTTNIYAPSIYEIYGRLPWLRTVNVMTNSSAAYTQHTQLEIFELYGANRVALFDDFLRNCASLRTFIVDTSNGTSFARFLQGCYSFNRPLDIDTSKGTDFNNFMMNCYSFNQPLTIDTGNGMNFNFFLRQCYSFNQPLTLDTGNGTDFSNFMAYCYSFNQPLNIDTSKGTTFASFMYYCHAFNQPLDINTSNGTLFSSFLYYCYSFNQPLNIDTSKGTTFASFIMNCYSFNQPLTIDTGNGTDFTNFMAYCQSFNQPLNIDTSKGTTFNLFLRNCMSFNQPLNIDTSNGTVFSNFLMVCASFNQPLNIDTSKGTTFASFLINCYTFDQPLDIDTGNGTDFSSFMSGTSSYGRGVDIDLAKSATATISFSSSNWRLNGVRLRNMTASTTAVNVSNTSLGVDAVVAVFDDLYDRTALSKGTVSITSTFRVSTLKAEHRAIATSKNWTITG